MSMISPENARRLSELVSTGKFKTQDEALAEALRLLNETGSPENGTLLSGDKWREKLREHLNATPTSGAPSVDDSRESINEGRGE